MSTRGETDPGDKTGKTERTQGTGRETRGNTDPRDDTGVSTRGETEGRDGTGKTERRRRPRHVTTTAAAPFRRGRLRLCAEGRKGC
ncbi:MAG: hypothetical protein M3350_05155 [Actinomycetota bacterium]|nr:hypothetical protein [Actinomycetota bacterium]